MVIMTDGFAARYLTDDNYRQKFNVSTPTLSQLAKEGVHAKKLISVYPSVTLPNSYSIATGLYPAYHGIVENEFYDPVLDDVFHWGLVFCFIFTV